MKSEKASPYQPVRALERGLEVLRALSQAGESSSARLAEITQLPRPTVHRILETLRGAGYVTRSGLRDVYRLTMHVRTLSDGYHDDDWIVEIAQPVMADLFEEVVWPTDLVTYDDGSMVLRTTTHARSPLSLIRAGPGLRMPMLNSASGRTYLAFCPEAERTAILELLARKGGAEGAREVAQAQMELAATRERGYGLRLKGGLLPKMSTIAIPVKSRGRVLACVNLNWITSALDAETVVKRYLPALRKAARKIESGLRT